MKKRKIEISRKKSNKLEKKKKCKSNIDSKSTKWKIISSEEIF